MEYYDSVFMDKLNNVGREILVGVDEKFYPTDEIYNELFILQNQKFRIDELMTIYHAKK